MVENRPWLTVLRHAILIGGVLLVLFPIWVAFVASTHEGRALVAGVTPLWPGTQMIENYNTVLSQGVRAAGGTPAATMMFNSLVMALSIAIGKIGRAHV